MDLSILKTELTTDPNSLGYAAFISSGDHTAIEKLMNSRRASETLEQTVIEKLDAIKAVDPDEYIALDQGRRDLWNMLLLNFETLNIKDPVIREMLAKIWPQGPTRSALINLQSREGSRTESLFGEGLEVNRVQIGDALKLP